MREIESKGKTLEVARKNEKLFYKVRIDEATNVEFLLDSVLLNVSGMAVDGLRQPTEIALNVKRNKLWNRKPIVGRFLKSASRNSHVQAKHFA